MSLMTEEEFEEIMNDDSSYSSDDCTIFQGLLIIRKYLPTAGIEAAEHDEIYSCSVEELLEAGITIEDATKLCDLNWMINESSLAHFA